MQNRSDDFANQLWSAAFYGDRATVARLVEAGVDVDYRDESGRSALTFAALSGQVEVAQDLIEAGAAIDPQEGYAVAMSPLAEAATRGDIAMLALLLEHGADPRRRVGRAQITAAQYAAAYPTLHQLLREAEAAFARIDREEPPRSRH